MTLPLYGVATAMRGFSEAARWKVIRARLPQKSPSHGADVALLQTLDDVYTAMQSGFSGGIIIGDGLESGQFITSAFRDLMVLPGRYGYLGDGDVIGFKLRLGASVHSSDARRSTTRC